MSLETKNYVATLADVEAITRAVMAAVRSGSAGRASYLRALVATTQHELGISPRKRAGTPTRFTAEDKKHQLAALHAVDQRFKVAVNKAASEKLPPSKDRALLLNSRTNFARSAKSTIKSWIRAGNDITTLVVANVTKRSLKVETSKKKNVSVRVLTNQSQRHGRHFKDVVQKLIAADPESARTEWAALRDFVEGLFDRQRRTSVRGDGRSLRSAAP